MCACVCVCVCVCVIAHQAPLSMEFSRQEYWRGLPFPFPGDLPDSGMEPPSPALAGGFFKTEPPGMPSIALEEESNILDFVLRIQPLFVLLDCSLFLHNLISLIKFVLFLCNSRKA